MQNSPSCVCCGCPYVVSDGNLYSDDFAGPGVDPGWSHSCESILIVGGQLEVKIFTGSVGFVYRSMSVSGSDYLIIIEAVVQSISNEAHSSGIYIRDAANPFATRLFQLVVAGHTNKVRARSFGSLVGVIGTYTPGQKFTIKVQATGGDDVRACFFLDEELVFENTGTIADRSLLNEYGLIVSNDSGPALVYFDNFSIHVGNP